MCRAKANATKKKLLKRPAGGGGLSRSYRRSPRSYIRKGSGRHGHGVGRCWGGTLGSRRPREGRRGTLPEGLSRARVPHVPLHARGIRWSAELELWARSAVKELRARGGGSSRSSRVAVAGVCWIGSGLRVVGLRGGSPSCGVGLLNRHGTGFSYVVTVGTRSRGLTQLSVSRARSCTGSGNGGGVGIPIRNSANGEICGVWRVETTTPSPTRDRTAAGPSRVHGPVYARPVWFCLRGLKYGFEDLLRNMKRKRVPSSQEPRRASRIRALCGPPYRALVRSCHRGSTQSQADI